MAGNKSEEELPKSLEKGLEQFCRNMQDVLEERLLSIVLYGGLAKGEYEPRSSDVNVMLVLKEVDVAALDLAAPGIRQGARDYRISPLLLSETNLHRSTDVFPIKFLDMQRHHRILFGKDVIHDLHIARDHLRLRCEQELKNLLLRLRQFYLQRAHLPELIEATLGTAISSFLGSLNVLVELKTGKVSDTKATIVDEAEKIGLDGKTLRDVLALKSGDLKPKKEELKRLYGTFMAAVQRAAEMADALGE